MLRVVTGIPISVLSVVTGIPISVLSVITGIPTSVLRAVTGIPISVFCVAIAVPISVYSLMRAIPLPVSSLSNSYTNLRVHQQYRPLTQCVNHIHPINALMYVMVMVADITQRHTNLQFPFN